MTVALDLRHYANEPVVLDRERVYEQSAPMAYYKPVGLWVSVAGEYDWPTWCRDNDFERATLAYEYQVIPRPDAMLLTVTTTADLVDFHRSYAVETEWERRHGGSVFGRDGWPIDWGKVAAQYQGIVISPYQWGLRLGGPQWYYVWDCASGCIWDVNAIESVKDSTDE